MKTWSAETITTDEAHTSQFHPQRHASWYAQGRSDAFGDRLLMFDNSRGPSLELLRFSQRISGSPDFEAALRERVDLLSQFRHDAFAKVRAVEMLAPQQDLTLVSNYVSGKRLSESLVALRGPAFAAWVIRELIPALADFQQQARGLAHGALTGDRIVLTPEGRLVIVEHVLGSALQRLQLTSNELWLRFGIATPPATAAEAVLDPQADVFQLALVAVAVLIGRPLASYEYPQHLADTLDTFERSTGRELPPSLRSWLTRALHLGGTPFESARDAQNGLGELHAAPSNLELTGATMLGAGARTIDRARWALQAAERDFADVPSGLRSAIEVSSDARKSPAEPRAELSRESDDFVLERETTSGELLHHHDRRRAGFRDYLLAAFAAIAVAQMGYIAYLVYVKAPAIVVQAPQSPPVSIAGFAPAEGQSGPQAPPLNLQALVAEPPRQRDAPMPSPEPVRSGGVRLLSPLELQVLEGDRVLGSSTDGPIVASAGRHEFELVNNALGYRERRVVNLKAGAVVSLSLPHPEGRISINSVHVGETPLANLSIPIGEHEVSFRHPSFGEQRRTALVRFDTPARISADLR
jgi:PEGA domain-containing protein